jgi:hypothetical protein
MNDLDGQYYSQYFKRYGQDLDERDVEAVSIVGTLLATQAKYPTPVMSLADTLSTTYNTEYSYMVCQVFVSYCHQLTKRLERDLLDADTAALRAKVAGVVDVILECSQTNTTSLSHLAQEIQRSYEFLEFIQDNSSAAHRSMSHVKVPMVEYQRLRTHILGTCLSSVQWSPGDMNTLISRLGQPANAYVANIEENELNSLAVLDSMLQKEKLSDDVEGDNDDELVSGVQRFRKRMRDLRAGAN